MRLLVAGVDILFEDLDARTASLLEDYAGEFRIDASPRAPDVRLRLSTSSALPRPSLGTAEVSVERRADGSLFFVRQDFEGEWHPSRGVATGLCWAERTSVASLLRVVCGLFLPRHGGLLVHASSVVSHRCAFLFPGKSGAGKTTLASLGGERPVLCDEISSVRRGPRGYVAMPTPFFGEMPRRPRCEPAPLALIGLPMKCEENAVLPASRARALAELLHCAVAFDESVEGREEVLQTGAALVESVPAYDVHFNLHTGPWRMLDDVALSPARDEGGLA